MSKYKTTSSIKGLFITSLLILLLHSCANIVAPTGGPKDELPPKLVEDISVPNANNNTNMKGDYIVLFFDEPTNTDNLKSTILSNPTIDKKRIKVTTKPVRIPRDTGHTLKGTKVLIDLNQDLDSNTTYVLNFGSGFKDLNEGKESENISIAFSTGPTIDSLSISGTIIDNESGESAKNYFVGLYSTHDTISPVKDDPVYFTSTNKQGQFDFNYLHSGTYKLIAFDDKNSTTYFEANSENIAFLSEEIKLDSSLRNLRLRSYKEDTKALQLVFINPSKKFTKLQFSRGLTLARIENYEQINLTYNDRGNQLTVYKKEFNFDSLRLTVFDSAGKRLDTLVPAIYDSTKNVAFSRPKNIDNQLFMDKYTANVSFHNPIITTNLTNTLIKSTDSTFTFDSVCTYSFNENNTSTKITCSLPLSVDTITITYDTLAFISLIDDTLAMKTINVIRTPTDSKGSLFFTIKSQEPNFIVYILNSKGSVLSQYTNPTAINFEHRTPQNIFIKVLIDTNRNGRYDTGDYTKNQQPERLIFLKDGFQVKAGWDITDLPIEIK